RGVVFADDGFQPRLVDRQDALLEVGDLLLVDIDAVDRIAHLRDAGPCHEADVATPYDRDVHYRFLVLDVVQPCRSPPRQYGWQPGLLGSDQERPGLHGTPGAMLDSESD